VKATLSTTYRDKEALEMLEEPPAPVHPLIQIGQSQSQTLEGARST